MADKEAQYAKPAAQVDLETRMENGNESDRVLSTSDYAKAAEPDKPEAGYVGVDPQYQNHANHTEAPGVSLDNLEDEVASTFVEALGGEALEDVTPEGEGVDETDLEDGVSKTEAPKTTVKKSTTTPSS